MKSSTIPSYLACYAAQVDALGIAGQQRLRRTSVAVVGAGGLGTAISTILATTGVGTLIIVDPQRVEPENFNRYPFMRPRDIGRPKVDVLAGFLEGRPHLTVVPVVGRAETIPLMRVAPGVQLLVSASNTVPSRLAVARLAVRHDLAHVSAAVADGREARGGFVSAWVPEHPDLACPACFLAPGARLQRGESLLASVVALVGAQAAALAIRLLAARDRAAVLDAANCASIDADRVTIEPLHVLRRRDCRACGLVRSKSTR